MVFDSIIDSCYSRREYPALNSLMVHWEQTKPFAGMNLLVGTPVFRNTFLQYRALMVGGAKLWIGRDTVLCDFKIMEMLKGWGFPIVDVSQALEQERLQAFDLVLDCAGQFAKLSPKYGFVELTRSGVQFYQDIFKVDCIYIVNYKKDVKHGIYIVDGALNIGHVGHQDS